MVDLTGTGDGFRSGAGERRDALGDDAPGFLVEAAGPVPQVRALDLVVRHRQPNIVEADLDQPAGLAGAVGFRADPLRAGRIARPQHDYRARGLELLLDYLGIS